VKVENLELIYYLLDTLKKPDLFFTALHIARDRNENSLKCRPNQRHIAETLHVSPRTISSRVKELTNQSILIPITSVIAGNNLRGTAQYFFLFDIETQLQMFKLHSGNGVFPEDVVRSIVVLTDILATQAIFQDNFGCHLRTRKLKTTNKKKRTHKQHLKPSHKPTPP